MKHALMFAAAGCMMSLLALSAFGQPSVTNLPYVKNPDAAAVQKVVTGAPRPIETIEKETQAIVDAATAMLGLVNTSGLQQAIDELAKGGDGQFGRYVRDFPGIQSLQILEITKVTNGADIDAVKVVGSTLRDYIGSEWIDLQKFPDLAGFIYITAFNEAVKTYQTSELLHEIVWADPNWANNAPCRHLTYTKNFTYQGKNYLVWNSIWLDK